MGFDNECIIDIHSYPREYFCPVCCTLVYPNEAFQAQCTHLYCKPCLVHIAKGSKVCPYDGYPVTESDSKSLAESDKALAEKVGKVKVHCLYFLSGCTWEGTLADCPSHCSGCSFGNSPVICNWCGIQIVHRQVHDHTQICPGFYYGQQTATGASGLTKPATTSTNVTEVASQIVAQSAAPVPQYVSATQLPVQNANAQAPVTSTAMATLDQWYQQQYQQYYHQYAGYDPYQQQQYYPPQQQQFQQYQQHAVPIQAYHHPHVYNQAVVPPQPQAQGLVPLQPPQRTSLVTQPAPQPHLQPQVQGQAQPPPQSQLQMVPQPHAQAQHPPQGSAQAQANAPLQAVAPNYQVNPQQPPHHAMHPQLLVLPPPPHGQPSQPPQFPKGVGMRPLAPELPVYQTNQPAASAGVSQAPHLPPPPVISDHSYPQPQTGRKMPPGAPQQPAVLPNASSGLIHPVQVYTEAPQQPTTVPVRPSHSRGSFSQQQPSAALPLQNQGPGIPIAPHQQFLPHGQQSTYPVQHWPFMQPVQPAPPHNYAQQQFSAPIQGQLYQQGHYTQQPPIQSQMLMCPSGPPQQLQNYPGIPMMPNQGIPPQSNPFPSGGFCASSQGGAAQGDLSQSINQNKDQNDAKSTVLEQHATVREIRSPKKVQVEKGYIVDTVKEEAGTGQNGTLVKDAYDSVKDGLVKSVIKQEKGKQVGFMEQAEERKPYEAGGEENETCKVVQTLSDSIPLKQAHPEKLKKLPKTVGLSSGNIGNEPIVSGEELHVVPPRYNGSHQRRSRAQVQEQPSSTVGAQEGILPGNLDGLKSFESQSGVQGPARNTLSEARGSMQKHLLPRFESQYGSQHVRPISSDQMSGAGEWRRPLRMNGARDENSNPYARERTHSFDQESRPLDKSPHGHSYDALSKLDPVAAGHSRFLQHQPSGGLGRGDMFEAGPEFGRHHKNPFPYHSPGRDYIGSPSRRFGGLSSFPCGTLAFEDINSREDHRFGEGSRSFILSSDLVRNPLRDGRFPPGHLKRGDIDDTANSRFGEHRFSGLLHNQIGVDDVSGPDGPGHLMKGKFSGPGYLSGHFNVGENAGPGTFPGRGCVREISGKLSRPPFSELVRSDVSSFLHFCGPHMGNNYPYHGMPSAAHFSGGLDSLDQSRKREPISNGWCRLCEFDCETVEGLEIHSQTREHRNTAMDIVKRIKLQNKKQRASGGHTVHEGGSRNRKVGTGGHRSKP